MIKMIFKGVHSNDLNVALYNDNYWVMNKIKNRPGRINPQSSDNPGVAFFFGKVYIAYKGVSDNDLRLAWVDGTQWGGDVKINTMPGGIDPKSNQSPNLVVFKNKLYMIYKAWNSNTIFTAWFDGTTWHGNIPINSQPGGIDPQSDSTPGVAVYKGTLHMVYKAWNNHTLYSSRFDGTTWFGDTAIRDQPGGIDPQSDLSPGLCVYKNRLYLVYKAWNDYVLFFAWLDGTTWYGNTPISSTLDPRSDRNPGMIVLNNKLYIIYKAWNSDLLYSSWFDGNSWKGNIPMSNLEGGIEARSNYSPNLTYSLISPQDTSQWMSLLKDELLISEISMPGTHDSAAIKRGTRTPWATQQESITEQLQAGIRVLDVRLKIKRVGKGFDIVTCHGDHGLGVDANEFQSFVSLMDECADFLTKNPSETVVMLLKVDDWTKIDSQDDRTRALEELLKILFNYPVMAKKDIPTLGETRGKIFLFSRIDTMYNVVLGTPLTWEGNTAGSLALSDPKNRNFEVFVQDQYKGFSNFESETEKINLVINTFDEYRSGQVLLNFASATWYDVTGIYVNQRLLRFFGATPANSRPRPLGWVMFDFAGGTFYTSIHRYISIIPIIISANLMYTGFRERFAVKD